MDIKEAKIIMDQVIEARSDGIELRAWEVVKSNLPTSDNSDYAKCNTCRESSCPKNISFCVDNNFIYYKG